MTQYRRVTFNHANLKRPVQVLIGTIAGYHWSDATASTHVYTTAGVFPVSETPDQVSVLIDTLTARGSELGVTDVGND
jgi:hypothetical protein